MKKNLHGVFLSLDVPNVPIGKKDVVFLIYKGRGKRGGKIGELRVSQGAIVWRGKYDLKGRKLGWARFDDLMQEHGTRSERRRAGDARSVPAARRR